MYNQPGIQQKPAPSFGRVQEEFRYRLRNFRPNDSFMIVEDMPRTKLIRKVMNTSMKGNPYPAYLIRISSNNFEADLELLEGELNMIAIACPKTLQNFKYVSLAFDGQKWIYNGNEPPVNLDPSVPLNETGKANQKDVFLTKMIGSMRSLESVGVPVDTSKLTKMCDSISPGNALELIQAAKGQGLIVESQGIFKVIE